MKKSSILAGTLSLLGLAALGAGCSGAPDGADPAVVSNDALRAEGAYMRAMLQQHGERGRMKIDLADDRQFQFLTSRLRASGITAETAPALFKDLLATRDRLLATQDRLAAVNPGLPGANTAPQHAETPPRCDVFIVPETLDETTFTTLSRVSCVDGAVYNYIDTYQYDEDFNALAYDFIETWNEGVVDDMTVTSTPPAAKAVWADGVTYSQTSTGVESYYYATAFYDNNTLPAAVVTGTLQAPVDLNQNGVIRYCLDRGASSADCDYKHGSTCNGNNICALDNQLFAVAPAPYDGNLLYMPMQGDSAPVVSNVGGAQYVVAQATAWLTLRNAGSTTPPGGFCAKDLTASGMFQLQPSSIPARSKVVLVPGAPSLGNAFWPDHCVDNGRQVDLNIEVSYKKANCAGPICPGPTVRWTTLPTQANPTAPPLQIWWGCLPAGTAITLADGTARPIEKIAVGQQVLSDAHGRALTVVDVVEGAERKPLVRVIDDRGNVVSMSSAHAMPIGGGEIVKAQDLQIGDRIDTKDGPTTIVSVDRPEMEGVVYNLVLGTEEELAALGPEATTMFADGVRVGDSRMQSFVTERAHAEELASRGKDVPEALRADYERSTERMARRAAR